MYHMMNDSQRNNQFVCYDKQHYDNNSFEENMKTLINSTQLDEEYLEFALSQGVFNANSISYSNESSDSNRRYANITSIEPALYRNSGILNIAQDIAIDLNVTSFNIASGSVKTIGEEHLNSLQKTQVLYSNNDQRSFYNMETFPNIHKSNDQMKNLTLLQVEHHIRSYEDHVDLPIINKENKNPAFTVLSGKMPYMTDNEFETANVFCSSQKQESHNINHAIYKNSQTQDYGIRRVGNETPISNVERSRIEKEMATKILFEYEMEFSDICVGESQRDKYATLKNIHTPNNHNVSIYDSSLRKETGPKIRNSGNKCHDFTTVSSDPKLHLNDKFLLTVEKEYAEKEILFPKAIVDADVCSLESHAFKNCSVFGNNFHNLSKSKQQSGERSITGEVSTKQVKRMRNLNKCMPINRGQKIFKCEICKETFFQKSHLTQHKSSHIGDKTFTCDVCHKAFFYKWSLDTHIRTHSGKKPFTCDICHKAFFYKCNLVTHALTHSGNKPFTCDICHKAFFYKCSLVTHIRSHTGEKPYSCDICHKSFARKDHLMQHVQTHIGKKPFSYDICHKAFAHRSSLAVHARTYSGEQPFSCDI